MTFLFAAVVALSAIAPPMPSNDEGRWIMPGDYPAKALRQNDFGYSSFLLTVSPDGRVVACDLFAPAGRKSLDEKTCPLLKSRARFHPAIDASGSPTYGTFSDAIVWTLPAEGYEVRQYEKSHPPMLSTDMVVGVSRLPGDGKKPVDISVGVAIGADDKVEGCVPVPADRADALAKIACTQVLQGMSLKHVADIDGHPVAVVHRIRVRFVRTSPSNGAVPK